MTDSSPFQLLTEAFQAEYRVNLSLERPDGSIVLTLSNERGVAAKRLIRPAQLHDLAVAADDREHPLRHRHRKRHQRAATVAGDDPRQGTLADSYLMAAVTCARPSPAPK